MEKVDGFGGFFFRSDDPKALAQWYLDNLGINLVPSDYDSPVWQQTAGPCVFAPFEKETDYFGNPVKVFMMNFRVKNLDAMVAQLEAAGTTVKVADEAYPNGRFAHLADPEGNPIELWEPA
ncbi:MAG: VOC family protein [Pseudomonadota bacterium]